MPLEERNSTTRCGFLRASALTAMGLAAFGVSGCADGKNQQPANSSKALAAGRSEEEALACAQRFSRDNARTPMQWDTSANAGFTKGTPWLPVHDDYETQNIAVENADEGSVLSWYRRLSQLHASCTELTVGSWEELMADSEEIYAFKRVLGNAQSVTLVNWTEHEAAYDAALVSGLELVAGSFGDSTPGKLRPLEATIWGKRA